MSAAVAADGPGDDMLRSWQARLADPQLSAAAFGAPSDAARAEVEAARRRAAAMWETENARFAQERARLLRVRLEALMREGFDRDEAVDLLGLFD